MKESSTPKGKKPNLLGWFLPLVVIVALLFYFGQDQFEKEAEVSQDVFWYLLASGEVKNTKIDEKWVRIELQQAIKNFKVFKSEFAETAPISEKIRQLASRQRATPIDETGFLNDVKSGTIVPTAAIHLASENPEWGPKDTLMVEYFSANQGSHYAQVTPSSGSQTPPEVIAVLKTAGVEIESIRIPAGDGTKFTGSNSLFSYILIQSVLPLLLIALFIWFVLIRPMRASGGGGGVLSFGRSRATLYSKENRTNVTFADVAGIEEAKEEVTEIIEFLKNPQRFTRLGGRIPRGVLLVGQPGAGKTLLAKAIAGEAEVPFFSISGSDFVEMFVGVGASRVRDLFKQAKENSPCIIFLDEIDAVGRKRGSGMGGGHDEREQTLNAILVEMDGFSTDEGVIIIAATNRPDVLDPALLRPGRFDREIVIDLPDYKGREEILKVHARKIKLSEKTDLSVLARSTPTFSGADLAAIINEAAIIAVMKKKDSVGLEDLEEARDKIRFGRQKKSRVMSEDDRKVTAYHEGGHALLSLLLPEAEPLHKVTIIPRGMALGLTMQLPEKDQYTRLKKRVAADISVAYGGRIAEELFCKDISTGAQNDIKHATELARRMVIEWGMSDKIGPINYAEREGSVFLGQEFGMEKFHSEDTAREIDEEVKKILGDSYTKAKDLLSNHKKELDIIAEGLLRYETLSGDEVQKLLDGTPLDNLRRNTEGDNRTEPSPRKVEESAKDGAEKRGDDLRGNEGLAPA